MLSLTHQVALRPDMQRRFKNRLFRWAGRCLRPLFGGMGSILMFHRVVDDLRTERLANTDIETSTAFFCTLIDYLRDTGYQFVSMDEACARLEMGERRGKPFIVITFDDGYLDNYTTVYPLLKKQGIPFTVYVTTGFIDRALPPWWYALEDHLLAHDVVQGVDAFGRPREWTAVSRAEKVQAYEEIAALFRRASPERSRELLDAFLSVDAQHAAANARMMEWHHVRRMADSGLVTIGAHTVSHPVLGVLPWWEARREIETSKRVLSDHLARPVDHFAFPYGSRLEVGHREFVMARNAGFRSATTTRVANIFAGHTLHMHALPRIFFHSSSMSEARAHLRGATSAWRFRGQRVVTA